MDPLMGFMALKSLRLQEEIRNNLANSRDGGATSQQKDSWDGWLSREHQKESVLEAFFTGKQNYVIYAIEEGREQEDIVLQRTRLFTGLGHPSWLPKSRAYNSLAAVLGCPSCGRELAFGLYRRCGHCRASLKYVVQCGLCDHLSVGVDFRIFIEELKCDGCDKSFRTPEKQN